MDLYDMVRHQDRKLLGRLRELPAAGADPGQRTRRLAEVRLRLEVRRRAMERIVYPILRTSPLTRPGVDRSTAEMDALADLLDGLAREDPAGPGFRQLAMRLQQQVRLFLEREEREIFSRVWQAIPEEQAERLAERLARELVERRRSAEG